MRVATYNVEWFTNLFDDEGRLFDDGAWSGRYDVTRRQQTEALGIVFTALDADAVLIVEAPDRNRRRDGVVALETFASVMGLRARKAVMGFASDTQQELAFLYDPDRLTARHDPVGDPSFDGEYRIDLGAESHPERVLWSRPPLELAVESAGGTALRLIGVHAKSKAPHGARRAELATRIAIENRRKQIAQCIWLRERVEDHLDAGESLVVLGDFNDGPGLDEFERLFGRSGVEIVLGDEGETQLFDPHAETARRRHFGLMPATARFWIAERNRWMQALLDYVMVSPDLRARAGDWRIWHPFDDPACAGTPELREALLAASDHFPVSVELDI